MVCFSDHENELLQRILIDPAIAEGRPTLRDSHFRVDRVVRRIAAGQAPDDLIRRHPSLTLEDIEACMLCARIIHIPGSGA